MRSWLLFILLFAFLSSGCLRGDDNTNGESMGIFPEELINPPLPEKATVRTMQSGPQRSFWSYNNSDNLERWTRNFVVNCSGRNVVPPQTNSLEAGVECHLVNNAFYLGAEVWFPPCISYIMGPASIGQNGYVISPMYASTGFYGDYHFSERLTLSDSQISELMAGLWYFAIYAFDGTNCYQALRGQILLDSDKDGVADLYDTCTNTPSGLIVSTNGCSLDQLCPCDGPWKNHGEYVKAMDRVLKDFFQAGLITAEQRTNTLREAAKSDCGKPRDTDRDGVPDVRDRCPNTPQGAMVDAHGCGIAQLCPCNGKWRSHDDYMRAVAVQVVRFHREGRMTVNQAKQVLAAAMRSNCGYFPTRERLNSR